MPPTTDLCRFEQVSESGSYPARLGDLTPAYLAQLPMDHLTGGPLGYQLQDGVFRLSTSGWPDPNDLASPVTAAVSTWLSAPWPGDSQAANGSGGGLR